MKRQLTVTEKADVPPGLKRHAVPTAKLQRLGRRDFRNDVGDLPHIDRRRISPAESQLQSDIRSMPLARLGQASQQFQREVSDRCQQALRLQFRDESSGLCATDPAYASWTARSRS